VAFDTLHPNPGRAKDKVGKQNKAKEASPIECLIHAFKREGRTKRKKANNNNKQTNKPNNFPAILRFTSCCFFPH